MSDIVRSAVIAFTLLSGVSVQAQGDPEGGWTAAFSGIVGDYELEKPENDWHRIAIQTDPTQGPYVWANGAGRRWVVSEGVRGAPGGRKTYQLVFPEGSPYPGHTLQIVRDKNGDVTQLREYRKDADRPFQTWVRKNLPNDAWNAAFKGVVGDYEREDSKNEWHRVAIQTDPTQGPYVWANGAGRRWLVEAGVRSAPGGKKTFFLEFPEGTPYPGHTFEIVRDTAGHVTRLIEFYKDEEQPAHAWIRKGVAFSVTLPQAKDLLIGRWKGNPGETAKHSPDLKREDNLAEFTLEFASGDAGLFVERGIVFGDKGSLSAAVGELEKGEGVNGFRVGEWNFNMLSRNRIVFEGVVLDRVAAKD